MEPDQTPTNETTPSGRKPLSMALVATAALLIGGIGGYLIGTQSAKPQNATKSAVPPTTTPASQPTISSGSSTIKAIKLELKLPSQLQKLGELQEKTEPGEKGTLYCVKLKSKGISLIPIALAGGTTCYPSGDDTLVMGGISKDYAAGRDGAFVDRSGYATQNGKYYAKFTLNRLEEIPADLARLIKNPNGVNVLIIRGRNIPSPTFPDGFPLFGTLGDGWIGAIINTGHSTYPGLTVQMKLTSNLTEAVFEQLVSSFKFTN